MKQNKIWIYLLLIITVLFSEDSSYQINKDVNLLQNKLMTQVKEKQYDKVLVTLGNIKDTGVELPKSFIYFEAKAIYESGGSLKEADEKFKLFMRSTSKDSVLYKQSQYYVAEIEDALEEHTMKSTAPHEEENRQLYICYEKKYETNRNSTYSGCIGSSLPCTINNKKHFGKYPTEALSAKALQRCMNSKPKEPNKVRLNVCYDSKYVNNVGEVVYNGCGRSFISCADISKKHFGKYANEFKALNALERCQESNPNFVD